MGHTVHLLHLEGREWTGENISILRYMSRKHEALNIGGGDLQTFLEPLLTQQGIKGWLPYYRWKKRGAYERGQQEGTPVTRDATVAHCHLYTTTQG